ncbi:hypothetical protein A3J90_04880 [candidate division WOR-1 bacterium RIFOXYC2_FULL_37_10]|uniref:AAA+ ATPase domain-containing protein n=1 Tax=candidate division WOR-1 bacterium RIFOXYB2_FULL_37_13 TaxID=1802579 RepID=A0A1F4SVJ9_UNCSA|nr:MAG: hypothetical protein A2310_08650 [candidate division WOR-1 bacterium RIFOXYB2_FULL_37_13]OGC35556.1 MAG: hypothetical protein A3J90_04880 [candidate division WOR-1 bacterium RIFOXYC2_FULL_37_10]
MFKRKIEENLLLWKEKNNRKPLIIRGARQTGKTTLVRNLSKLFQGFVELNLEKDDAKKLFSEVKNAKDILKDIELFVNKKIIPSKTLLFIDEIQNSAEAIKSLRYFYEEVPELHIISAGSLLEVRMKKEGWSFPVGRVEFLYLYPTTFEEFLNALGENNLLEYLGKYRPNEPLSEVIENKLFGLLSDYMIIGGMPEVIKEYLKSKDLITIKKCHDDLILSFKEDFVKYAKHSEVEYLKLLWDKIPFETGKRIKYSKLGGEHNSSRSISNAFDILHEAMLVERIYPTTSISLPLVLKFKASPKAMFLDIGLCAHVLNLKKEQIKEKLINPSYGGGLFEEFCAQEFMALNFYDRNELYFWMREEKGASSEVDFILNIEGNLVPVEVKSSTQGSLKSLHQFLYRSNQKTAIRVYSGKLKYEQMSVTLPNGIELNYNLLSIPFFILYRIKELFLQAVNVPHNKVAPQG